MLTVHHLRRSQSERAVWLCEELALPYRLVAYDRDPDTILAPPELKAVHPAGTAPVVEDGPVLLAESGAVVEYVLARHGSGRLRPATDDPAFPDYLYWFHFANGTLQPNMMRNMVADRLGAPADSPARQAQRARLDRSHALLEARLRDVEYLAGAFGAADIMTVFSLTTMRLFLPVDLSGYPAILAYLARIGRRDAYRRAMAAGDPGFEPLLA